MGDRRKDQAERMARYAHLIEQQAGKAVRPFRADGYVNLLNRYGTQQDTTERYRYQAEPMVPDELLTMYYEGNGLFAKIIDTPAEEAIKHGFKLEGLKDQKVEDFFSEALDELDWEETAMTAIRWARLFGGAIAVMLINDGRGLEEPLDWRGIRSIDDIRVYDRSVIQPEEWSMFSYDPQDPFRTRGSRLGMPERYRIGSRYGSFVVHDSRCLVFQNGILPENTTSSVYQLWGIPEYIRIQRAIRDAEIAHGSATKLLDRSVQAVYKMKDLAAELATEEGEDRVLRRLQTIDMARGLLNSITIDSEGEDYGFRQFQFSGVSDVIDSTCNFLSALTSIPQTILFGRSPAGMNATGDADLENWYNALERIQKRMVKKNLRYLLSVVFQAGVHTGEIDEVPKIKITFNPLWSLSDMEQADLEQKRAQTQLTRAQTAQTYIDKQVIDPSEVRKKLADSEEFDVENMLDEYEDEDLFAEMQGQMGDAVPPGANSQGMGQGAEPASQGTEPGTVPQSEAGNIIEQGTLAEYGRGVSIAEHDRDPGNEGEAPPAAPAATKLPQDMSEEEKSKIKQRDDGGPGSGNWGHTGRPGKIGGSASGTGGVQHRTGTKEEGFSSKAKERAKAKASGGSSGSSSGGGTMGTGKGVDTIQAVTAKLPKAVIEEPGDKTRKISKPFLEKIGYGRKPSVLSDDEFKAAESDYPVQYRGINSPDAYDRVIGNEFFVGAGANGSGANTTPDRATAEHFAGENGGVVEIKLDKSAKVISDTELIGKIGDFRRSEPADGVDKTAFYHLTSDPGCIAASLGYDAIYDSSTGWLNIINRGKMIVRKQEGEASETGNLRKDEIARIKEQFIKGDSSGDVDSSVGVLVISDGKILTGTRHNDFGYGLICGPGGHIELGETPAQAAFRETEEEFGISPKDLIPLGRGQKEPETGLEPYLFLCTEYEGEPDCVDLEMTGAAFRTMEELDQLAASMFRPFADSLEILKTCIETAQFFGDDGVEMRGELVSSIKKAARDKSKSIAIDGGPGSGNFGHEGRPGEIGGSGPADGSPATPESARAQGRCLLKITKKRFNDEIATIVGTKTDGSCTEEDRQKVIDLLDEFEPGSTITAPAGSLYDKKTVFTKQEDGYWKNGDYELSSDGISYDFFSEDADRPKATKAAGSKEELERWRGMEEKANWRNQEQIWRKDGSFSETMEIKLKKTDLDHAGVGTIATAKDGTKYEKREDGWYKEGTREKADMRKVGYPTIEADFFTANFGLNGISAEECARMRSMYEGMPDNLRKQYEKTFRSTTFKPALQGCSCCSRGDVYFDGESSAETIVHECAHAFDREVISKKVPVGTDGYMVHIGSASENIDHLTSFRASRSDFESMAKVVGIETNGEGWFSDGLQDDFGKRIDAYFEFAGKHEDMEDFACVSDAISGMTLNGMGETMYGGHSESYWQQPCGRASAQSTEYWANFCVLMAKGNSRALALLKEISPNRYAACLETYREAFGDE